MNNILRLLKRQRVNATWLAAAVLAGLLLHIGLVLAITHLSSNPAIAAMTKITTANQIVIVPPATPGHQLLPFQSPAERIAICRFDLHRGQVALHAVLGGDDWIVAIYAPTGANVFSISGADLERRTVDLLLAVSGDSRAQALPIARDSGLTTTVGLAARTGIAVISAPATRPADAAVAQQLLGQAACTLHPRPGAGAQQPPVQAGPSPG